MKNNTPSKCCPKCNFKGVAHDSPNITYFGEEYCGKPDCPCHTPVSASTRERYDEIFPVKSDIKLNRQSKTRDY